MQTESEKRGPKNNLQLLLLGATLLTLSGCSTIGYYGQSIIGHNRLMMAREPIDKVLKTADPELKVKLETAKQLRQFAVDELSLPDNTSYSTYVDLDRDYPVWSVVAAEEFSLSPKSWCYPVIGCASYRGYFSKDKANEYAKSLQAQGFETHVGAAIAYSTLGWFSDPLLPSMMRSGEAGLAENMFHELTHQVLYVNGNSAFNEAFASVVGEQGAIRWLQANNPDQMSAYQQRLKISAEFNALLNQTKAQLAELYAQDIADQQKRDQKQQVIEQLFDNYSELKQSQWNGRGIYDRWFETPITNARLAAISTYRDQMPRLNALLIECENDFQRYFDLLSAASKRFSADVLLQNLPADCEI